MKKFIKKLKSNILEILFSPIMMLFIIFILGLVYFCSIKEANENKQKDLNHANESSQVIQPK